MKKVLCTLMGLCLLTLLIADAATIRDGIMGSMLEFIPSRTTNILHGNLYAVRDTAICVARYDLPTINWSLSPERVQITYYNDVAFGFDGYPEGNKIVINWGDSSGDFTLFSTSSQDPIYVSHRYNRQVACYNVTIRTYRLSGTTYIEETDRESRWEVGIFPEDDYEIVAYSGSNAIGKLTRYLSHHSGNIKKPLLFVEGFNFHNSNTVSSIIGLNQHFYKNLLLDGYDLYFLTFEDCQNSLFVNAGLVLSAIQSIKSHFLEEGDLSDYGCAPISVIGYSMGGVLARIALASAEDENGFAHGCNLLLTVDSPHRGIVLNDDLQSSIRTIANFIPEGTSIKQELIRISSSPVIRQFFRNNIYANSLPYDFIDGSDEYRSIFDFLNPCDAYNVDHINQDVDYYNSGNYNPQLDFKSGFPWKQNNIKKYAVSFGEHEAIGNVGNYTSFANVQVKFKLLGLIPGSMTLPVVDDAWYDTCPSSYFPTEFHFQKKILPESFGNSTLEQVLGWVIGADYLKFKFNVNYNLPVVPVISGLCITNREFAEQSQTQYTPYSQIIAEPVQTPFDQYYIANDASSHQVLQNHCASWIRLKLSEIHTNSTIGHISGTMKHGNQLLTNQQFVVTNLNTGTVFNVSSNASGIIKINNMFINSCFYEIKHVDAIYYPQVVTVNVDMFGNADIGIVSFTIPTNVVEVNKSPTSNACHTISNAFELCRGSGLSHIIVYEGTYNEKVFSSDLGNNAQNFILEGVGTVILHSDSKGRPLHIANNSNNFVNELTIRNIIFEDSDSEGGGGVYIAGNIRHATFENCTIRNCGDNYQNPLSEDVPIGLVSCIPIHIANCDFYDNEGAEWGSRNRTLGVIYLYVNNETLPSIIENCRIHDNSAGNASAIHVMGNSNFIIRNNIIYNNFQKHSSENMYCIKCKNANNVEISNNLMDHNWYEPGVGSLEHAIGVVRTGNADSDVLIKNNTISHHRRTLYVKNVNVNVVNNLIDVLNMGIYFEYGFDQSMLRYSHNFMKTHSGTIIAENYDISQPLNTGNLFGDPQLDANYAPIWTTSMMSPCIDAGTGEFDPDGTPADIGAIRAMNHNFWEYTFRKSEAQLEQPKAPKDTYHWVCYPVVNSLNTEKRLARSFFHELLGKHYVQEGFALVPYPDVLQEIIWKEENSEERIYWMGNENNSDWSNVTDAHYVRSPQGYKVKLLPVEIDGLWDMKTVKLHHSGFLTPANSPFMIYGRNSNGGETFENWVGYYNTESALPTDAFSSIWNDITMIKAKDWCLYRDPDSGIGMLQGKMMPLNCGDMVIVTTLNDHEFQWDTTHPTDPQRKAKPEAFDFKEKADYVPVYVDLSEIDLTNLKEIGLKLDGICKGAVVVEKPLEQICVYLEEGEYLYNGAVQLEFFYDSKSQPRQMKQIALQNGLREDGNIGGDPAYPVYNIKVTDSDLVNTVTPVLSLEQNYPNPFNPTTSIGYSIDEAGPIALEVYNIKGQLVKSLYKGEAEIGNHAIVWNGMDNSGKACSSGVYFYKLKTSRSTLVRKMLMLK